MWRHRDPISYKSGDLLIIETGEASDISWDGPVRCLRDFSEAEASWEFRRDYLKNWQPRHDNDTAPDHADPDQFLLWLIRNGWVEEVPCHSWHVGSYGKFDP